ncbi:MAG TPA: pyruvate formate-lyase-activating protein [Acholeplasma sp.]|jgi:pyruvate formate lyase activating enzyme
MTTSNNPIVGNVHSIETFGAFDGPGIRYVLFLQGCPLKCKFCHNRDTWDTRENHLMTTDEVIKDYKRYRAFYKGGGITVSGGEATLQIEFLTELFKKCKEEGIHTCLDTAAGTYSPKRQHEFRELLTYTDLVLLDIKHIDNEKHKWLVGAPNTNILEFAKFLDQLKKPTILRHVLLPGINSDDEYLLKLRSFIDGLSNMVDIDILPYHKKGIMKWEKMGIPYELYDVEEPTKDLVMHAESILKDGYHYMKL